MNHDFSSKWSSDIAKHGFTAIPNLLIANRQQLGMSTTDFYVLIAIEKFRWDDAQLPWPSLKSLAQITSLSTRTVARSTQRLEELGLIEKIHRYGTSNLYDLSPIVLELNDIA